MVKKVQETICIVEDDPMMQEIYGVKLKESGYKVLSAMNGVEALEVMRRQKPDVAIIDIKMPVMDGIELIAKMDENPELARIPVIILTNQDNEETVKKTAELRSKFYLIKSLYTPQKLVGIVKEVLSNR